MVAKIEAAKRTKPLCPYTGQTMAGGLSHPCRENRQSPGELTRQKKSSLRITIKNIFAHVLISA
ncbi:MAG: hypothetical protein WCR21_06390, partial [Bacteroidota bacterium]